MVIPKKEIFEKSVLKMFWHLPKMGNFHKWSSKAVHESDSLWMNWDHPWERWLGLEWFVSHSSELNMNFCEWLTWLGRVGMGIRPTPAFGHGCADWVVGVSKYSRIPNLVKIWLPIMENWPSRRPSRGAAKRSHHTNFWNKIIENDHEMRLNYSSNSPVRTSILDY
jgi:hypothetical protein